jgi:hypothetical protein
MPKGTMALSDNRYGEGGVMSRIFFKLKFHTDYHLKNVYTKFIVIKQKNK